MYSFNYQKPSTVAEAVQMLNSADDGQVMAGGQTLIPTLKQRLASTDLIVDLSGVSELRDIQRINSVISVGAMVRHAEVAGSQIVKDAIPALASLAEAIGDPQVRNAGTIGGSIANNDPAADYPAAIVGLNASIHTNERVIAADDFFTGLFETALNDAEIITSVSFQIPERAAYMKFPNPASRYAIVGVFVAKFGDGSVRVAVTGAGPAAFRVGEMESALQSSFAAASVENVRVSHTDFNADIHASAEYRGHLVTVMAKRAVAKAAT